MLNHAKDNDWPPQGLKVHVPTRGCFTLSVVQAMSRGGITNLGRESFLKWRFPLNLLFLLDCTHYDNHSYWWLYLAEVYAWPP